MKNITYLNKYFKKKTNKYKCIMNNYDTISE